MLQPASQNVLGTIDHNHVFLICGRCVDTIGIELTNLFSKLFMFVSISPTNASDGIRRAFCILQLLSLSPEIPAASKV